MKNIIVIFIALFLFVLACKPTQNDEKESKRNKEAREDSLEMVATYAHQAKILNHITADVETQPVQAGTMDDAADDPAFWFNVQVPDSSLVFGSNKKGGIYAYYLSGKENAYYPVGEVNNIDVRQTVVFDADTLDILGGSDRSDNSVITYIIDKTGKLSLLFGNYKVDTTMINEVYGFCMYKSTSGQLFSIVNGKNGFIQAYKVEANTLEPWHSWKVNSQPEGMVADDSLGVLYVGEEEKGIWRIDLNNPESEPQLITSSSADNNKDIRYDIEGLSIYYGENNTGFLLASSQGSFSYALFDRIDNHYITSFTIKDSGEIDGVEETDGLDVYSWPIGERFPNGLLMVQDGFNYDGKELKSQNFKLIDLNKVLKLYDKDTVQE